MSAAARHDHDVFISYATVDDRPAKNGWVSAFVKYLDESLSAAFGQRNPDRIWFDRSNIDEEASLTEQIRTKVQKSACMVVILSQGYAKSQWCRQEREAFLAAVAGQPEADRRLFLIDIGNLDQKDRPQEFCDKRGRLFYVQPPNTTDVIDREPLGFPIPDPEKKEHKEFFGQVDQLARALHERVSKLPGATQVAPAVKAHAGVTLFVAESADDVAEEREEVVRFLSDHFHVLPAIDAPLPSRWDQWQAAVDEGLKEATLFIQVLGALPGRKIVGSDQKLVIAQFERAQAAGKRIVAWRKGGAETIADERLKELASAAEFCGPIAEFQSEVKRIAVPPPPPKIIERPAFCGDEPPPLVFIQAGVEDQSQAEELSNLLSELNCYTATPLIDGPPEKIREDLEANLAECDGLILFYGQITPDWVRSQFRTLPRRLSMRKMQTPPRPLKALAICKGDPPGKPNPGINAKDLEWIDLTVGAHRDQLAGWVAALRTGEGA
ncbi:MAG: toll/interleukin-1 receptor domain-containing protein [Planctomycetales bacterium]